MRTQNPLSLRRTTRTLCLGLLVASLAATAQARAGTPLAPSSTTSEKRCGGAAQAVPAEGESTCDVAVAGSAESGETAASVLLVSPGSGTVPWKAAAGGYSEVVAIHHLDAPVPSLDFTVQIHVNHASVSVENHLGQDLGFDAANLIPASLTGHNAAAVVAAGAAGEQCLPSCVTGSSVAVESQWGQGTRTNSGGDYVIELTLRNSCTGLSPPPGCGQLPAGDVLVTAGSVVSAAQPGVWGTARASVEAVVTGISVD